jgi:hypothetical protein
MRSIYFDRGAVSPTADNALEDVRLASAILLGAASAAEAELAAHAWSPGVLAAARPLGRIIKACNELEAALAGRARPAVNTAHMPSPSTRASIAAVSAVSACMPSVRTRETIAVLPRRSRPLSPDRAQPFPIHRATFRRSTHFRLSSEGSTNAHEQVN